MHPEHYDKVMSLRRDRQDRGPPGRRRRPPRRLRRPATSSRRPCSPTSPRTPGSSRRRSSARSSRSPRSTPTRRRSRWPTTPSTASPPTSGRTTSSARTTSRRPSRPAWCGSTRNNVRDLRTPFGGVKASGLGHEGGYRSIDFYTDQQAVHITLGEVHNPTFGKQDVTEHATEHRDRQTLTSSGFYVSQEAPIHSDNPIPTPQPSPPDILRCAYMELVVTDLAASRAFYVDVLGLYVTEEDENADLPALASRSSSTTTWCCARARSPPSPRSPTGCAPPRTSTRPSPSTRNSDAASSAARRASPRASATRCASRTRSASRTSSSTTSSTSSASPGATTCTPPASSCAWTTSTRSPRTCRARSKYMQDLGFRVTEDIQDDEGTVYAAWMRRKPTVHDTAMTGGDGPRMHHVAFATHEKHNILAICDKLGALRTLRRDRARPRPARRLQRVLPLPARPRRAPRGDLHAGLLHRRPRQPRRHLGRARQPAPRLVGQPGRPVLVHRGLPRPRPRRQPAAGRRPHRHERDGRDDRRRRLLLHPPDRRAEELPSWKQGEYKLGHQL